MATFAAALGDSLPVLIQCGTDTDIGGGRENQDDFFVHASAGVVIFCVLDGHGREVGKVAANTARAALIEYFTTYCPALAVAEDSRVAAYECLVRAHNIAHAAIKIAFRAEMEKQGFEVEETEGGYLRKRRGSTANWTCIHGGSSCSIIMILKNKCYIANVGDSTGILCGYHKAFKQTLVLPLGDAAKGGLTRVSENGHGNVAALGQGIDTVLLTAEHSPECPEEFKRLRDFRCNEDDRRFPSLSVVYDSQTSNRADCPPVFRLDEHGEPRVLDHGCYYKNVRKEWASLVATPNTAQFQDALAFTRSLGDLHLHTYGVTHEPQLQWFDLDSIWSDLKAGNTSMQTLGNNSADNLAPEIAEALFCIVLATDGVWDNWAYEEVTRFVMHSSCIGAVMQSSDGAQRVAQSFMQRNAVYAKRNFGNQADNATGIVAYVGRPGSNLFTSSIVNSV